MLKAGPAAGFWTCVTNALGVILYLPEKLFTNGYWMSLLGLSVAVIVITTITRFLERR